MHILTPQRTKSLELNWLARRHKALPLPDICFCEHKCDDVAAFYSTPWPTEHTSFGVIIPAAPNGVIVLFANYKEQKDIASTIAHEYRHHYQWFYGIKYDHNIELNDISYYANSTSELDALNYECRVAPTEERLWMQSRVRDTLNKNHNHSYTTANTLCKYPETFSSH